MATYIVLNIIFLLVVLGVLRIRLRHPTATWWITLIALFVLTAIFDNVIIGLDIVGYDQAKLLGLYIGNAPIEDFFYALLAAIIVPALWQKTSRKQAA